MADREIRIKVVVDEKGSVSRLDRSMRGAQGSAQGLSKSLRGISAVIGAIAASQVARTIINIGRAAVDAALQVEALNQKLVQAAGSAAGAAQEMDFVRSTVDGLGLDLVATAEGFAKFSVALKGTSLEGQAARDIFTAVSKASAVMRLSAEQTGGVFTALEQIVSKGTVSAEELRGQLGERLPGAFRFAAEAMGVTTEELGKLLQRGELTAEDLLPRLAKRLEEEFGASAVEAANSSQAAFNRFNNTVFELRAALGEQLLPIVTGFVNELNRFARSDDAKQLLADLTDISRELAPLFSAIVRIGLAAELQKITTVLKTLVFLIDTASPQLQLLVAVMEKFDAAADGAGKATSDWDLAGLLRDANNAIGPIAGFTNEITVTASAMEDLGEETVKTARQLDQELAQAMIRLGDLAEDLERRISDDLARLFGLDEPIKIPIELEIPDFDTTELFGIPEVTDATDELNEAWQNVSLQFAQVTSQFDSDLGVIVTSVISVVSAISALVTGLNAATVAATSTAVALKALDTASVILAIVAALFELAKALDLFGLGGDDTGRRLTGTVSVGEGGVFAPTFGSRETREAFENLSRQIETGIRSMLETIGAGLPETFETLNFRIETIVKGGQERFRVIFENGFSRIFDSAEEAAGFALQQFGQELIRAGVEMDEAVRQLFTGFRGDFEGFGDALERVSELADQAAIALGEAGSQLELEISRIPGVIASLTRELEQLGLSADQVTRLVGGQVVAFFQSARQQITGEQLSVEQRKAIQRAQAELFNAQLQLEIARLEAEREALIAQREIGVGRIEIDRARLQAEQQFTKQQGAIFNAALKVQGGFLQASAGIVNAGASTLEKQIQAIDAVLAALRKIGLIDIPSLRLPNLGRVSGNIGNVGRNLGNLGDAASDAARELERTVERLRNSIESLQQFRAGLLAGPTSPLSFGRRLLVAQREFGRQTRIARRTGEVADFQQAAQTLLDLARQGFGSTAGFQSIFRDVIRSTESLEREFGQKIEDLLAPPEEQTAQNTAKIAEEAEKNVKATEKAAQAVEKVERATKEADQRNQVSIGRIEFQQRKQAELSREQIADEFRRLRKSVEKITA